MYLFTAELGWMSRFHFPLTPENGGSLPLSRDESPSSVLGLLLIHALQVWAASFCLARKKCRFSSWSLLMLERGTAAVFSVVFG